MRPLKLSPKSNFPFFYLVSVYFETTISDFTMSSIRLTFSEAECLKLFLPIAKYIREKQMTIIKIKLNAKQIFAITQCNKLLAHGDNSNFMLGCGGKAHLQNDVVEIWGIRGKEIVDLKCGKKHCLALTKCNAVFSWGKFFLFK